MGKVKARKYSTVARSGAFSLKWGLSGVVCLLLIWQLLSVILGVSQAGVKKVPGLQDVIGAMIQFSGYWPGGWGAGDVSRGAERTIWGAILGVSYNSWITLVRCLIGFALGVAVGVGLGLLVSWSQGARRLLGASAHFMRMMPLLAMMPLFGLWFGRSETGTYVFVAFAVAVLLFVITLSAVDGVSDYYMNYALSLGADRFTVYRSVIVPAALPEIRNGLLLAVPFAWSAVLAAEFIGKQYGLGRILNYAHLYAETDVIAATGLVVMLLAAVSFFLVRWYLNYLTRWV